MAIKLYRFIPQDRSCRVAWLLKEMGVEFEPVELDARQREHLEREYQQLSPPGTIPAVVDDEVEVFESGAAVQYLADRYGAGTHCPLPQDPDRPAYLSWLYFASASLDPACFPFVNPVLPEEFRPPHREYARLRVPRMLDAVQQQLGSRQTILERGFTAADIPLTSALDYAEKGGCLEGRKKLQTYLDAMRHRPTARAVDAFVYDE